jgi:hypothetical protein
MSDVITNPATLKAIEKALQELSNSMTRQEAERDLIKDIITKVCDDHELDKKIIRKMARVYHKRSFTTEVQEHEEFEVLYENVLGATHG